MKNILRAYIKAVDALDIVLKAICLLLFNVCLYILFCNICGRALGLFSFTWSEEFGTVLIFYLILLGSALAARKDQLIRVDFQGLIDLLTKNKFGRQALPWFQTVVSIVFYVLLLYSAYLMMELQGNSLLPALHLPKKYLYLAMPIGSVCLILNTLASTLESLYLRNPDQSIEEAGK